ncbi:hypothetical protein RSAG8_09135, partial [Rhizoctonia solani AG-8 WAC10335]
MTCENSSQLVDKSSSRKLPILGAMSALEIFSSFGNVEGDNTTLLWRGMETWTSSCGTVFWRRKACYGISTLCTIDRKL